MPIKHSFSAVANTSTIKAADWNADHTIVTSIIFDSDVALYRGGANTLKTDSKFNAFGLGVSGVEVISSAGVLNNISGLANIGGTITDTQHGPRGSGLHTDSHIRLHSLSSASDHSGNSLPLGTDVNLYRAGANTLKTDNNLIVGGTFIYLADVQLLNKKSGYYIYLNNPLVLPAQGIYFGGSLSGGAPNWGGTINLYSGAPDCLETHNNFYINGDEKKLVLTSPTWGQAWMKITDRFYIAYPSGNRVRICDAATPNEGILEIGDVNLYKSGVNTLRTDDTLSCNKLLTDSNVLVSNLNADMLDGYHAGQISGGVAYSYILGSNEILTFNPTERSTSSNSPVELKEISLDIPLKTMIRTAFSIKVNNIISYCSGRVYKNNVAFGTERLNGTTAYVEYTEDLDFTGALTYEIYCYAGVGYVCYVKDQKVMGSIGGVITAGK